MDARDRARRGKCDQTAESVVEQLLDDCERERLVSLSNEAARREYLVSHAMVRTVLSIYASPKPRDWRFHFNAFGKPTITNSQLSAPLRFNLSHTRGLAVCAIAWGGELGVDVESTTDQEAAAACMQYFSVGEQTAIKQHYGEQSARFFDYWTLKEAYLKACGSGLSVGLDKVRFHLGDKSDIAVELSEEHPDETAMWQFLLLAPGPDYRCAIARRRCFGSMPLRLRIFRGLGDRSVHCSWAIVAGDYKLAYGRIPEGRLEGAN